MRTAEEERRLIEQIKAAAEAASLAAASGWITKQLEASALRRLGGSIPFAGQGGLTANNRRLEVLRDLASETQAAVRGLGFVAREGGLSAAEFAAQAQHVADTGVVAAGQLGSGVVEVSRLEKVSDYLTRARVGRADELQRLSQLVADGVRTPAQAAAQRATLERGATREAFHAGIIDDLAGEVRWVMAPEDVHCNTCPGFAKTYRSLDAMLGLTGGFPGAARTDCHGNCLCHVEGIELRSSDPGLESMLVQARSRR